MRFLRVPLPEAVNDILGHSLPVGAERFRKGRRLTESDCVALQSAGHTHAYVARFEQDDIAEDLAAERVALTCRGPNIRRSEAFTGRCNLYSTCNGLLLIDADRIRHLNTIDEAITVATLAPFSRVEDGEMLATVKIIPFAASRRAVAGVEASADVKGKPAISVVPFKAKRVGLVISTVAGEKPSLAVKAKAAIQERLLRLNCDLAYCLTVPHSVDAITSALLNLRARESDPILVFGGSAIVDRDDVIPASLVAAGGKVDHFGMPVDPGNLLLMGSLGTIRVVGVPTCARSPKLNGFDWILERLCADLPVRKIDIMNMGVGGLLKEIPSRPMPRSPNV